MKLNIFSRKNLLDEMQEQTLLKVESRCFWLLWWGLLIAIVIQQIMGVRARELAGEGILFTLVSLYMVVACLRNGIWDRHIRASTSANLAGSLVGGIAIFVLRIAQGGSWPGGLLSGIFTALLCFVVMQTTAFLYRKRHEQLEHTEEDDHEGNHANQ